MHKESELPPVDSNFIIENVNLCNLRQKSSAPYNKKERLLRRQEVMRLHFELGLPATKIAEDLQVNRNTINADIQFWWSQLDKEWNYHSVEGLVMRQIKRLESQRLRLNTYLEAENNIQVKLSIEKLLVDIDNRISQIYTNVKYNHDRIFDLSAAILNGWSKKLGLKKSFIGKSDLISIPEEDGKDIKKMIEKARIKERNRGMPRI